MLLFGKQPAALSCSTDIHWLEELNSSGHLITSLRSCIVPEAQGIRAVNTPVHMYAATASRLPHTPTWPLINRLDYQQDGGVGFVLICAQKMLTDTPPPSLKNGLKGSFYLKNLPEVSWECCSNPVKGDISLWKSSTSSLPPSLPPRLSRLFVALGNAVHCVAGLRLIVCQFELWHIRGPNPSPPPQLNRGAHLKPRQWAPSAAPNHSLQSHQVFHRNATFLLVIASRVRGLQCRKHRHPHPPHPTHPCTHAHTWLGC